MGKTKRQKKQWRKIDTQEVDDFLEKATREERQGLSFEGIPDADLFYEDKEPGKVKPSQGSIKLPKKLHHRQRLTRAEAILQGAQLAAPVTAIIASKKKRPVSNSSKIASKTPKSETVQPRKAQSASKDGGDDLDLWVTDGQQAKRPRSNKPLSFKVPAVQVDPAGCSINPDHELHQEVVAEAVAAEMRKIYDKDLRPTAPLSVVDYEVEDDELKLLQVDAESDDDDAHDVVGNESDDRTLDGIIIQKPKSRKERNREMRRLGGEAELAIRRREKAQKRDLSQLKQLLTEVNTTLSEREMRCARRAADLAERAATEPPRLGKHKFEPLPLQVLTTEEIEETGGSLRTLKPTAVLVKDRFKSLQRRGVIEPRRRVMKKAGKRIEYIHGQRADKAAERQAEVDALVPREQPKGRKKKK